MDLNDIISYLKESKAAPLVKMETDGGMRGANGSYNLWKDIIQLNEDLDPAHFNTTLIHEYTHALDNQIKRESQLSGFNGPSQQQLREQLPKLRQNSFPSYTNEERNYRNNPEESLAFGVAHTQPNADIQWSQKAYNPHQDYTRHTEADIMLDLARRAREERNRPKPSFMDGLLQMFR
jgi:hypothetical protein